LQIDENEFGKPSTLIHTFTERETGSMHRAMKDKMGKGYSFLHLTHAAMLLALVKINPPPPKSDPQAYVPLIFMRGILYLKSTYAFRVIPFWPVCQCNGTIIYEDIIKYAQADGKENDVTTIKHMTQAMKIAKETYAQSLARRTTLLPTSITVMEMYATMVNR